MKKHIIILSIFSVSFLISCTSTKQISQDKSKTTSETSSVETIVSDSHIISSTHIVESQDTMLLFKGLEFTGSAKINDLIEGDTIVSKEADLSFKIWYDSTTKSIMTRSRVKPREVAFKYNKITDHQEVQAGTITSVKQELQKQTVQTNKQEKFVSRPMLPFWLVIILAAVALGLLVILFLKFKRFFT